MSRPVPEVGSILILLSQVPSKVACKIAASVLMTKHQMEGNKDFTMDVEMEDDTKYIISVERVTNEA